MSFRRKTSLSWGILPSCRAESLVFGVGFWGPSKEDLFRLRKEIEMDHEYFIEMATAKPLTKVGNFKEKNSKQPRRGLRESTQE